jgi:hypothetical protein
MLGLAAAMIAVEPVRAAEVQKGILSFRSGGVAFKMPLPKGYCLPSGTDIDAAQLMAAGDTENVTHALLVRCDANSGEALGAKDYLILQTPRQALLAPVTRGELLQAVGAEFEKPEFSAAIAGGEIEQEVEKSFGKVLGTEVTFDGAIRPLGRDDVCAFMGGVIEFKAVAVGYKISAASCITSIGNRVMAINWYGPDTHAAAIAELLKKARGVAESMTGEPVKLD